MKRIWGMAALLVMLMGGRALAQTPLEMIEQAHPGETVCDTAQSGDVFAAVVGDSILCVAQKQADDWVLTVDNNKVGAEEVWLDGDVLCWRRGYGVYSAPRSGEGWGLVSMVRTEMLDEGRYETRIWWEEGNLRRQEIRIDAACRVTKTVDYVPVKAAWAEAELTMDRFDGETKLMPYYMEEYNWWPGTEALSRMVQELFPEDTFQGGSVRPEDQSICLLVRKPNGETVIRGITGEPPYAIVESTPLPEGSYYGVENFTDSLHISGYTGMVGVGALPDGRWGVTAFLSDDTTLTIAVWPDYVGELTFGGDERAYGEHPWNDLTTLDWTALPNSLEEATAAVDGSAYRIVNNPNPTDRLHLRTEPDRSALSLGKFYNGTPVRVLEDAGEWVRVEIGSDGLLTGWMMSQYLADSNVAYSDVMPQLIMVEGREGEPYYTSFTGGDRSQARMEWYTWIIGVVNDEWYILLNEDGQTGYLPQAWLWPGNG